MHKGLAVEAKQPSIDFCMRDGREVAIRPVQPGDEPELRAFVQRLSPESRRRRFFGPIRELTPDMAYRLTNVDGVARVALVATFPGDPAIRAVGRFDRLTDSSAEIAFTVEDALQGQGLGTELLWLLAERARDIGFRWLIAIVLPENRSMLDVFRRCGLPCTNHWQDGVIRVEVDLGEGAVQPRLS
jgi:GNAT superfamily N-acetyltransferase